MSETSFGFLLLGSVGAVGFALSIGTLAAMLRYRRTGTFPGHDDTHVLDRGDWTKLWLRVVGGIVLGLWGVWAVIRAGVF